MARLPSFNHATRRLAIFELGHELLVAFGLLLELGQLLFKRLDVGQDELGHDGLGVARRVDERAGVVDLAHDVRVFEVADHLADGVALADVGEELISQAGALGGGTLDQARDVDELNRGGHDAARVHDVGERLETVVGNVNDTHVGVDRGERVVGGESALFGECSEQRGLAHVGQSDDSNGKRHGVPSFSKRTRAFVYINFVIIDR